MSDNGMGPVQEGTGSARKWDTAGPLVPLKASSGLGRRFLGALVGGSIASFLFVLLIAVNVLQVLSLVLVPFSRRAFRRFNREVADWYWSVCVWSGSAVWGIHPVVTGDALPERENALCMSNHQQMSDITFLLYLAKASKRLGDMKWIVKKVIKYVPGVGWGLSFLDCVFLERNWAADEAAMKKTFAHLHDNDVSVWLMIFPEGTRIRPAKLERSRQYARSIGQEPLDYVLWPRTKGFVASVKGTAGHIVAVYDFTIGYENGVPTLWQYVVGLVPRAHVHVRRFPIEELPRQDDEALAAWLIDRYRDKDRLLEYFHMHGHFPERFSDLEQTNEQGE